ncbi:MAG: hypothetical protein H6822_17410 [Planctomycetaceae bacterium]|nr:hypothetical protein [Planctomycetales bacterium]MCB9923964.1 hypothetical protein [Planctomycetaceae bacterium]
MPIRVVCKHCGKQFSAWDDLIGKTVKCPKCQQQMTVHSGNEALDTPAKPAPSQPTRPVSSPPAVPNRASPRSVTPPMPNASVSLPTAPRPTAPDEMARPSYAVDDFDDSDDLPYACPHCHQAMPADEDLCDRCGYHRVLQRRIDVSEGINKPDKSVGFERLFRGQLADRDSAESTLLMIKVFAVFIAVAFLFVCHPWSWLVAIVGGAGYFVLQTKRRSSTTGSADPSAVNQDVVSTFMWALVLGFQRAVGWRVAAWPFPTTKVLTLHDSTFTDQDLQSVEGLSSYETLDLEGTQLSNAALEQLARMKQLRFVVLRRTNVTLAGVQRLQQALPKVCIWY